MFIYNANDCVTKLLREPQPPEPMLTQKHSLREETNSMSHNNSSNLRLRTYINKLGALRTGIFITISSMAISVGIRVIIWLISGNDTNLITNLIISAFVPLLIAPFMSYYFVGLLMQIDAAEQKNAKLVVELQHALAQAKTLSGLLPICATCKKIRDDAGYWHQVEVYIRDHAAVDFSHGMCPDCEQALKDQISKMKQTQSELPQGEVGNHGEEDAVF